jgi:uncharacterized flavoprotein (TIGR03862 family)
MCAYQLSLSQQYDIHIFDAQKSFGRKLLVAGNGGFNLTHGEEMKEMIQKYHDLSPWFKEAILSFDNDATIDFIEKTLNVPTYKGTSNRVFPKKGYKPAEVLKSWIEILEQNHVHFHFNKKMVDFDNDKVHFEDDSTEAFDAMLIAVGGRSWKKTGSDGNWLDLFNTKDIDLTEFSPSNVGLNIKWPESILNKYERSPIKYVQVKVGQFNIKGDIMFTPYGLEGTPIYASSYYIRKGIDVLHIDFKPELEAINILKRLEATDQPRTKVLKERLKLKPIEIDLIKAYSNKEAFNDNRSLVQLIKHFPIAIEGFRPIDEAISSAGGVKWENLTEQSSLKKFPNIYLGGEMLDWDAPTGGYLLQACFSSGAFVAKNIQDQF